MTTQYRRKDGNKGRPTRFIQIKDGKIIINGRSYIYSMRRYLLIKRILTENPR